MTPRSSLPILARTMNKTISKCFPTWLYVSLAACSWALLPAHADDSTERFTMDDYYTVEKIDAHFHLRTRNTDFVTLAKEDKFRFVNIAVHSNSSVEMEFRLRTTFLQLQAHPERIAAASAFPMAGWDAPDWQKTTIAHLDATFEKGAVAVKVWKNIGMEFRDRSGELVMIDNPRFDPIFAHLAKRKIRLIGHLGEPKNCWLPLEKMTVKNDRSYFENNPEYHMFRHPDMPTYEDQIGARNRMLAKNPDLHFIGAHFGSLEWSVDELAQFLDRFPNATVDTAARMGQLQHQSNHDRDRVIAFLTKYQDRIIYGTDFTMQPDSIPRTTHARARQRWLADWRYFNTDAEMKVPELDDSVRGIALPKRIVEKIYRLNAQRVFPTAWRGGKSSSRE